LCLDRLPSWIWVWLPPFPFRFFFPPTILPLVFGLELLHFYWSPIRSFPCLITARVSSSVPHFLGPIALLPFSRTTHHPTNQTKPHTQLPGADSYSSPFPSTDFPVIFSCNQIFFCLFSPPPRICSLAAFEALYFPQCLLHLTECY